MISCACNTRVKAVGQSLCCILLGVDLGYWGMQNEPETYY